jgi:hypothetical protein
MLSDWKMELDANNVQGRKAIQGTTEVPRVFPFCRMMMAEIISHGYSLNQRHAFVSGSICTLIATEAASLLASVSP